MIEVLIPGMLDLVMDLGRTGYRGQGVPAGGAADWPALIEANRLLDNPDRAAGLEMLLRGPRLRFAGACRIALCGAAHVARLNGASFPAGRACEVRAGDILSVGEIGPGARAYLAVAGGIGVEPVLGSRSTFVPGGFGGHQGRALRAGDVLGLAEEHGARQRPLPGKSAQGDLRLLPGPQLAGFDDRSVKALVASRFRVTANSSRMGLRLQGAGLRYAGAELPSQGVLPGALQVPPGGQPIILGWDGPVTGGYPVIAGVIAADLNRLGQLRPGDELGFTFVTREQALAIWQREMAWL